MENEQNIPCGVSVTQRIKRVKQPRGGYVNPKLFTVTVYDDGIVLGSDTIHPGLVGLTVDYLTRVCSGSDAKDAFVIALQGSMIAGEHKQALQLCASVKGLDDVSIISACRLSGYDVCFRAGMMGYKPVMTIQPDKTTIDNIRHMVLRGLSFLEKWGPKTLDGFTFKGGYTDIVSSGDGDFLTKDTLWDFKVSVNKMTSKITLQLLMYYLMGKQSIHRVFDDISHVGVFNPRLNTVYRMPVSAISNDVINCIRCDVIGYK